MCRLVQSYRQNDLETILPSKEYVNDVEPASIQAGVDLLCIFMKPKYDKKIIHLC